MTNPQKGIWSLYNSRHDQSTMGIDTMNNISNNNKNTLCSYIILIVVVVDVLAKYDMLLSRSWSEKLERSLQLGMTYMTTPIFGGQFTRLYKETKLAYIVSDPQNPNNYLVYVANQDL
jgi:hypothetical protein